MITILEHFLKWLDRKSGCFQLTGPVVIQHGESWLRIAPDDEPRWFFSENLAMEYTGG